MRYTDDDFSGLMKVAFGPTVGDVIRAMNADMSANAFQRRQVIDAINRAHLNVNESASRIPYILGGGVLGNFVAKYLGGGGFMRGVGTVVGAMAGNSLFNRKHPDPNVRNGYRINSY